MNIVPLLDDLEGDFSLLSTSPGEAKNTLMWVTALAMISTDSIAAASASNEETTR